MKIHLMSETEYNIWAPRSRASYAVDKMKANCLTQEEAEKTARDDFNRLLPDGRNSKDNFLFTAKDESKNILGFIWFCIRGAEGNKRAFICDVIIEEQHRGKGYGKQMMLLVEKEARKKGLNRIGLHVFGFNNTAIRLYQSLGYATTDLVMEKNLSI
ncbi:MAG: GNAT family N-acetyltransferase [Pseudobdellovibrionaceae bacterium]